jgi:hypothetical protein
VAEIQQMIATVKGKLAAMKLEREELMKQVEKEKANGHLPGPTGHLPAVFVCESRSRWWVFQVFLHFSSATFSAD